MFKKLFLTLLTTICILSCGNKEDKTLKIAAATYPMDEIVKIAAKNLEKKGYKTEISLLTDYVTANIGLNAGDFDANFHQHEPFMGIFNSKNDGKLVKIAPIYNVYVGFYSKNLKSINDIKKNMKVAIPNDPTNMSRALKILEQQKLIKLNEKEGLVNLEDIVENSMNFEFLAVAIPALVQAYNEADLVFNWPSHMLKIGVSVKDALFLENDSNNVFAIILAAREDNKDSQKIKDLKEAMQSKEVKDFIEKEYKDQGYVVF